MSVSWNCENLSRIGCRKSAWMTCRRRRRQQIMRKVDEKRVATSWMGFLSGTLSISSGSSFTPYQRDLLPSSRILWKASRRRWDPRIVVTIPCPMETGSCSKAQAKDCSPITSGGVHPGPASNGVDSWLMDGGCWFSLLVFTSASTTAFLVVEMQCAKQNMVAEAGSMFPPWGINLQARGCMLATPFEARSMVSNPYYGNWSQCKPKKSF